MFLPVIMMVKPENHTLTDNKHEGVEFSKAFNTTVAGSNGQKLLINSKNGAVALVSSDGKTVFNSMSPDAARYTLASVLKIRLRDKKGDIYIMDSTDNSVDFGTVNVLQVNGTNATIS